ncbi:MFS general substrate transporter [Gloeophyllum trabeum ATCC 11539]|uniref:MFS general substrate transporter n=1 Tax=Gloeophyllum trabeum (strain ATCC 11539 / FP-39264 / Madison 617) TaxID=670483 RepID=S7Q2M1_GLOTA|nr:MFS general substrate transporter [Gloeophyllum trabeum ATCC 11539]EPQ54241.1 MFS general substrate transporter [Gloeophyllum trabeum ATCC 11539]
MKGAKPPAELTDQTNFLPTRQVITVYLGLSVALACSFLEQTIVATALPRIASDLHSGSESSWVPTAYLLTSLAFTPLYGRWSDIFGRKVVLLAALAVFFIFSLACALAQTMIQLIVFRAFQGIGGGGKVILKIMLQSPSVSHVSDIVSLKDRGKYQGINEAIAAVSNGVGPILGGVFSQYTTWRWAFWLNLPLGGAAIVVCLWLLPLKKVQGDMKSKLMKIDYVGSGLTILSSILLLVQSGRGGVTYPWLSAQVLVPLILGVIVLAGFVVWEARYAALPIVPVHIFKYRTVNGVYISTLLNGMTFFAVLYYVPQFLQLVQGEKPMQSSLLLLPFLCPIGQITARTGIYRPMVILGYALWTVGQGLLTMVNEHTSKGLIIGALLICGLASGFTFQTSLIACQAAVPRHDMAVVTGVRMFVRLFGSTITLAICATIINNTLRTALQPLNLSSDQLSAILNDPTIINANSYSTSTIQLSDADRSAIVAGYSKGFTRVFYLTVAYTIIATLAAVFLIQQHELKRADDDELKKAAEELLRQKKMRKSGSGAGNIEAEKTGEGQACASSGASTVAGGEYAEGNRYSPAGEEMKK